MPPGNIRKPRNRIRVLFRGEEIGILTWVPERNSGYFFFSPDYFTKPYDLCPVTHPKGDPETRFAIYGSDPKSPDGQGRIYQGLPPFLADSLPDRWGNAVFDRWFRQRNLPESAKTPITKLSFIGDRAMGALEFRPMTAAGIHEDKDIDIGGLYKEALDIEEELSRKRINSGNATISNIAALGTSPGGSRKKAVVSISPDGAFHSGKTSSEPGWRDCIIKFNTPEYSLCEIEQTYHDLATAAGIPMTGCEMVEIEGTRHFLTERFDRRDGRKIMTQTLAAMNPEAETYEDLFRTCRRLGIPEREITDLYRQTVFNFLLSNTDDHAKNFSFMMEEDNTWHLTPAYDLTFIIAENGIEPERNHCMSLRGKFSGITEDDLIIFARKNDIKAPESIIRKTREVSLMFEDFAKDNGVDSYYAEMIADRLDELGRPNPDKTARTFSGMIDGHRITDFRFAKNSDGNIRITADMDGTPRKAIITPKKTLHSFILKSGFNSMPERDKVAVIRATLLKGQNIRAKI